MKLAVNKPTVSSIEKNVAAEEPKYHLVCGDSRKVLKEFPSEVFSCVVTSPPYWGMRTYGHKSEFGREPSLEQYIENIVSLFKEVRRLLRKDGVVWLVMGDTYTSGNRKYRAVDKKHGSRAMTYRPKTPLGLKEKDLVGLPWRVAFALQADGWYLRTDVVWAKPNPLPESVKDRPHRSHEFLFMLSKSRNYFFDREAFEHPVLGGGRFSKSVWTVSVGKSNPSHPAPFPLELIMPCIVSSSRPGDLILDPFAGVGSVGLASLRIGRRFVGVDLIKEHVRSANVSLKKLIKQNTLHVIKPRS